MEPQPKSDDAAGWCGRMPPQELREGCGLLDLKKLGTPFAAVAEPEVEWETT